MMNTPFPLLVVVYFFVIFLNPHKFHTMDPMRQRFAVREQVIGMLGAGSTQKTGANALGVTIQTLQNWCKRHRAGYLLNDKSRSGRPTKFSQSRKLKVECQSWNDTIQQESLRNISHLGLCPLVKRIYTVIYATQSEWKPIKDPHNRNWLINKSERG